MSKQVGTVFADNCEVGCAPLQYLAAQPVQSGFLGSQHENNLPLAEEQFIGYAYSYHMNSPATRFISSPEMATLIDTEVQHILNEGRETAYALLTEHSTQLTRLALALLEHEQLNRAEFERVIQR